MEEEGNCDGLGDEGVELVVIYLWLSAEGAKDDFVGQE